MTLVRFFDWLQQRWKLLVRLFFGLLVLLVIADATPAIVDKTKAYTALDRLPGFWSLFGFLGCIFFIFFSKFLGKLGIWQKEDYYDD